MAPRPVKETASLLVAPKPAVPSRIFLVPNWVLAAMLLMVWMALAICDWLAARAAESWTPELAESSARPGSAGC